MKYSISVFSRLCLVALLTMPLGAMAAKGVGKVIVSVGDVAALDTAGDRRTLKRRSSVYSSDTVTTQADSKAQLRFTDGSLVSLGQNSLFKIEEYQFGGDAEKAVYNLIKGSMQTISGAIGKVNKENYQLKTPVATIGIRGTFYQILLTEDGGLIGGVKEGAIVINNKQGPVRIEAGQFFKMDSATSEVVILAEPPAGLDRGAQASSNDDEEDESKNSGKGKSKAEDSKQKSESNSTESNNAESKNTNNNSGQENNSGGKRDAQLGNPAAGTQTDGGDSKVNTNPGSYDQNTGGSKESAEQQSTDYSQVVVKRDGTVTDAAGNVIDGVTVSDQVNEDGSVTKPDGAVIEPDGTVIEPDGTKIETDGTVTDPDGTVNKPDGTVIDPDGTINQPDGTVIDPDGTVNQPDGTVIDPDGTINQPDGAVIEPDGTVVDPDGTKTSPDGTVTKTDGTVIEPDGTIISPDGSVTSPDGTTTRPDGSVVQPDGSVILANGNIQGADGSIKVDLTPTGTQAAAGNGYGIAFLEEQSDGTLKAAYGAFVSDTKHNIYLGSNNSITYLEENEGAGGNCFICQFTPGSASLVDTGGDSIGVNWGRWSGDFNVYENGVAVTHKQNFHFFYTDKLTPYEVLANLSGTADFWLGESAAGGTNPTDQNGNVGTLDDLYLTVDFSNMKFTSAYIDVTIGSTNYSGSLVSDTDISASGPTRLILDTGELESQFVGTSPVESPGNLSGLGIVNSYHIKSGSDIAVGTAFVLPACGGQGC